MTREPRLPWRLRLRLGAVVLVLLAGAAVALTVDLPTVAGVRSWLDEGGAARWLAAVLGVSLALQAPVSRSAISVLLGAVVGFPAGLAVALGGGLLGGLAGFALSRWLGRGAVARLAGARVAALDRRVGERGFASVLAARIAPVAPFMVVSYAAGLSSVRLVPYLLGTAVGLVPWSVLYVGIGASVAATGSSTSLADVVAPLAVLASCALMAAWLWSRRVRPNAQRRRGRGSTAARRAGPGDDLSTLPSADGANPRLCAEPCGRGWYADTVSPRSSTPGAAAVDGETEPAGGGVTGAGEHADDPAGAPRRADTDRHGMDSRRAVRVGRGVLFVLVGSDAGASDPQRVLPGRRLQPKVHARQDGGDSSRASRAGCHRPWSTDTSTLPTPPGGDHA